MNTMLVAIVVVLVAVSATPNNTSTHHVVSKEPSGEEHNHMPQSCALLDTCLCKNLIEDNCTTNGLVIAFVNMTSALQIHATGALSR